jgi:nitrate/nitrite transport system ATP-binding protein
MAFLEVQHVGKRYADLSVLHDVNLSISQGEFVAIVGYSGSGKTTLISLLAGLAEPDEGRILLGGRPVRGPGPERAVVFQNYSLLPWLTVYENVFLAVDHVFRAWPRSRKRAQTERYLELVHLTAAAGKRPNELSGGMRQRVSVARALAMDPQVLLLDEPLSALDALTRATLQTEIERIWEQDRKTVVLITNDVDEGILLADRILCLSPGPGATLGPAVAVDLARPRDRRTVNHDPSFKRIRREVFDQLVRSKEWTRSTKTAAPSRGRPARAWWPLRGGAGAQIEGARAE